MYSWVYLEMETEEVIDGCSLFTDGVCLWVWRKFEVYRTQTSVLEERIDRRGVSVNLGG